MDRTKLGKMSIEELWTLHAEVADILGRRMKAQKAKLEMRLRKVLGVVEQKRRPYPRFFPNIPIQKTLMKPGRVVASSLGGWHPNSDLESGWTSF